MSDSTRQGPQGPDEVEVEESGLPLAIAHKFGPDITRALAGGPGPYEVNVSFGDGRPSDDELEAVGLFAIPGGDMAGPEDLLSGLRCRKCMPVHLSICVQRELRKDQEV